MATAEEFEALVREGIEAIPEEFRERLSNVAVVVSDEPTGEQLRTAGLGPEGTLFGLYEGVPQTEREAYNLALPDKITIFRGPIEREAADPEDLRDIAKLTIWHEIAHHFGMDEDQVEAAEARRMARRGE